MKEIKHILHCGFKKVTKWFNEIFMVLNQDKCHFMCLGKNTENETSVFKNKIMKNNEEQKIFEITIDNTLYFKCPVNNLCYKSIPKN